MDCATASMRCRQSLRDCGGFRSRAPTNLRRSARAYRTSSPQLPGRGRRTRSTRWSASGQRAMNKKLSPEEIQQLIDNARRNSGRPQSPALPPADNPFSWRRGTFSAEALQNETFPPLKWIVPNMIPAEGTSLLCSKPKFGKSWLVLDQAPPAAPHDEATSHIRGQVASASHHQDRVAPPARGWPYRYSGLAR